MYKLALLLSALLAVSPFAFSDEKKQLANTQCEKVMDIVSAKTGRNFGDRPCDDNKYSMEFWMCVEKRMESGSSFNFSLQRCERANGLNG